MEEILIYLKQTKKCILTGEKIIFGSMQECARYHGVVNKNFVMKRCNGKIKIPYCKKYQFEDYNE